MNGEHSNAPAPVTTDRRSLHTPGPWCVEDPFDHELVIVQAGKASHEWQFIATIPHGDKDEDDDDIPDVIAERNARLIAAAPELLEALKELLDSEMTSMPPFESGKDAQDAWADRRAAARNSAAFLIAKATGEYS